MCNFKYFFSGEGFAEMTSLGPEPGDEDSIKRQQSNDRLNISPHHR